MINEEMKLKSHITPDDSFLSPKVKPIKRCSRIPLPASVNRRVSDNMGLSQMKSMRCNRYNTRSSVANAKECLAQSQLDHQCNLYKTPSKKTCFNPVSQDSALAAWSRVFTKFSPSTEVTMSPIQASVTNLQGVAFRDTDSYIDIATWVINMSEQFFYDNSLILLNKTKKTIDLMKKSIRRNYTEVNIEFFKNLVNVSLLGKGAFGSVYVATDVETTRSYAVKFIAPKSSSVLEHCENILNYMMERNSVIRAMNSPFVTQFFYSLQVKSIGGLYLFFEYCVGDLFTYIDKYKNTDHKSVSEQLHSNKIGIIQSLDKKVEILETSLIYVFELFCALDFLVKANIIHQDIKPENLMISETLHLKIGDFGLIYNTRAIHRKSNYMLVARRQIDAIESSNYEVEVNGTLGFEDLEIAMMMLESHNKCFFRKVKQDKKMFNAKGMSYKEEILVPTFLIDTWAAGVVSIELLFRGFKLFKPTMMSDSIYKDIPRGGTYELTMHLTGRECIYNRYIRGGLVNAGGESLKELMEFIASIFRPRARRSMNYTSKKFIYKYNTKYEHSYIDISKLENLKPFKTRRFNSQNILTFEIPNRIRELYKKPQKILHKTFDELLKSTENRGCDEDVIGLRPGLAINYFK